MEGELRSAVVLSQHPEAHLQALGLISRVLGGSQGAED